MRERSHARGHEDQARSRGFAKEWQKSFSHADDANGIDGQDFAHDVSGTGVLAEDTGVVDENVEPTAGVGDVFGCGVDGGVIGDVDLDGGDGSLEVEGFECGDSLGALSGVTAAEEDVVGRREGEKVLGGFEADTLICACGRRSVQI